MHHSLNRTRIFCALLFLSFFTRGGSVNIDSLKRELKISRNDTSVCKTLGLLAAEAEDGEWQGYAQQYYSFSSLRLKNTKNASEKYFYRKHSVEALLTMAYAYRLTENTDSCAKFYQRAQQLSSEQQDKQMICHVLHMSGNSWAALGKRDSALSCFSRALKFAESRQLKNEMAVTHKYLGNFYSEEGENKKANFHFEKGIELVRKTENRKTYSNLLYDHAYLLLQQGNVTQALEGFTTSYNLRIQLNEKEESGNAANAIGTCYYRLGDIKNALEFFHKALLIQEQLNDDGGAGFTLNNIGVIYNYQGEIEKAKEYWRKSLVLVIKTKDQPGIANAYHNLGFACKEEQLYDSALFYYNKSLNIRQNIHDLHGLALSYGTIGGVHMEKKEFQQAREKLNEALRIYRKLGEKDGEANVLNSLSRMYIMQESYAEAAAPAQLALSISQKNGIPENIRSAAENLRKIYEHEKNFKKAIEMAELFVLMRDSIKNNETKKAGIKAQLQYEYRKKAAADSAQQLEETKIQGARRQIIAAQLQQEKYKEYTLWIGLVLLGSGLFFAINRFRIIKKQKRIIEEQKRNAEWTFNRLNEKNMEILDSIHYAKRIQTALMTPEKMIEKALKKLRESTSKDVRS